MEVLYVALCALAIIVGVLEVRQSFKPKDWEVRAGLFALLLVSSLLFMTLVDWEKLWRICGTVGIGLAYITGVVLGYKEPKSVTRQAKPGKQVATKKIVYPHKGDDFCVSGYEDPQGNRVPLGS